MDSVLCALLLAVTLHVVRAGMESGEFVLLGLREMLVVGGEGRWRGWQGSGSTVAPEQALWATREEVPALKVPGLRAWGWRGLES